MSDEICVKVKSNGGRCLVMYYVDPVSGKRVVKSTGTSNQRDAELRRRRVGGRELQRGGGQSPSKITWQEFRQRYQAEHVVTLAPRTGDSIKNALDKVEKILAPDRLSKLTAAVMSRFQAELRKPRQIVKDVRQSPCPPCGKRLLPRCCVTSGQRYGGRSHGHDAESALD